MKHYDAVIIGGGITGLVAAYNLSKSGRKVLVLEKERELGGAVRSLRRKNYYIEESYHHVFMDNKNFFALVKELGIYEKLKWNEARTGFIYDKLYEFSKPSDLIRFKPLTFVDKLNFLKLMLKIKLIGSLKKYDKINANKWFKRNSSASVYNKLFKKLIEEKWSEYSDTVSAAFMIGRFKIRGGRGKIGEKLGYMEGGFHLLLEELAKRIRENKGTIKTSVKIKKIYVENNKITKMQYDNATLKTDFVISTAFPTSLSSLVDFPEDYLGQIKNLKKQWMIIILVGLKKKLTPFYWTNVMRPGIRFGAIIEHTNLMPKSQYNHENIVYLTSYPPKDSQLYNLEEKELFERYFADLMKLFPHIKKEDILWYKVIKEKYSSIVYETGFLDYMPKCKTPIKNLFVCGMFNTYPDRNMELSIRKVYECINLIKQN